MVTLIIRSKFDYIKVRSLKHCQLKSEHDTTLGLSLNDNLE